MKRWGNGRIIVVTWFCSRERVQHRRPIRRGEAERLAGLLHSPVCKPHSLSGDALSIQVVNAVVANHDTKGGERLLLLCMALYARDNGENVFPGVDRLATDTQQTRAAVQRQLRNLEKRGFIKAAGRSKYSTVNYTIVVDKLSTPAYVVRPSKIVDHKTSVSEPKESIRRMPDSSSNTSKNRQQPEIETEPRTVITEAGNEALRRIQEILKGKSAIKGMV